VITGEKKGAGGLNQLEKGEKQEEENLGQRESGEGGETTRKMRYCDHC
jgi:hypothetical protein